MVVDVELLLRDSRRSAGLIKILTSPELLTPQYETPDLSSVFRVVA